MAIKQSMRVLGARCFNDVIEGQKHDFTKLNVQMDMPDKENCVGMDSVALPFGTSANFERLKNIKFPCDMELELAITTKGMNVVNFVPPRVPV
jgi:hypothetical protein